MFYNTSHLEVHNNNEKSTRQRVFSLRIVKSSLKRPLIVTALVVAAAIAIAIGVGIWSRHKHSSHILSTTIRCGFIEIRFILAHFSSSPAPPAAQFILNDTSLAAVSLPGGDRYVFFQDTTGLIRSLIYTQSNNQWSTSPSLNPSFKAKMHTPLAANIPVYFTLDSGQEVLIKSAKMCSFNAG